MSEHRVYIYGNDDEYCIRFCIHITQISLYLLLHLSLSLPSKCKRKQRSLLFILPLFRFMFKENSAYHLILAIEMRACVSMMINSCSTKWGFPFQFLFRRRCPEQKKIETLHFAENRLYF